MFLRLKNDESGTFAIVLALVIVPVIAIAGVAIDYTRMADRKAKLQATADAAVFAAHRDARNFHEFKLLAAEYVDAHLPGMEIEVTTHAGIGTLSLSLETVYDTAFMGLAGKQNVTLSAVAELANVTISGNTTASPATRLASEKLRRLEEARDRAMREIAGLSPRYRETFKREIASRFAEISSELRRQGASSEPYLKK